MIASKLEYGDTIGVISPASPEDNEVINKKIEVLKNLGFNVLEGNYLRHKFGFLAGTDRNRAKDLVEMFENPSVNLIMCFRGGYGTMRLMPYLDFKKLKKHPKIFVGYSDITILLNSLYQNCGLITFHGPMVKSDLQDNTTINSLFNLLMAGNELLFLDQLQHSSIIFHNFNKKIAGTLVGGNLSLICSSIGTNYEINLKDKIVFLEDVEEPPYKIDRMLTQLIHSGKLSKCKGLILGQFTSCTLLNYNKSFTLDEVINERILSLNIPTCCYIMSGHGMPNLTLPIGAKILLDPVNKTISTLEKVVK